MVAESSLNNSKQQQQWSFCSFAFFGSSHLLKGITQHQPAPAAAAAALYLGGGEITIRTTDRGHRRRTRCATKLGSYLFHGERERDFFFTTMEEVRDEGIRMGGHHHASMAAAGVRHNEHTTGTKRGARFHEVSERGEERGANTPPSNDPSLCVRR